MKRLIFLELNELNFDAVNYYLRKDAKLPGFKKILQMKNIITNAENDYDSLEPWIQWPSIHTGKKFAEHKIFRLGDIVNTKIEQYFEKIEQSNYSVGAISPMNASNKLKNPAYFIPDPWTQTPSDGSFFSNAISGAISQAVNDNSQSKLTLKTIFNLIISFLYLVSPLKWGSMFLYSISTIGRPWRKALFLDLLLNEIHKTLLIRKKPNFSTIFLNAGAHIQHHYFFNSPFIKSTKLKNPSWYISEKEDPFFEMLTVYDSILMNLLKLKNTELVIATGLSQKPFEELKFYYRIKNHKNFLNLLKIDYLKVVPRMTRDFLISFDNEDLAKKAEIDLSNVLVDSSTKLFEQIDNRGKDIFVVLTYPFEIKPTTILNYKKEKFSLIEHVNFVAIKNGEHQNKGFAFFSKGLEMIAPKQGAHVSEINKTILNFFNC